MKPGYLFLLIVAGATLAGYVLVFGDQGYLQQSQTRTELEALRNEIRGLEKENQSLNEQYLRLLDRAPRTASATGTRQAAGSATILKFEDDPADARQSGGYFSQQVEPLSLTEARALFLTGMFFLAVLGYYVLSRMERLLAPESDAWPAIAPIADRR